MASPRNFVAYSWCSLLYSVMKCALVGFAGMAMVWIKWQRGTVAIRTQCVLFIAACASVCNALRILNVEMLMVRVFASGGAMGIGVCGLMGGCVVWMPALIRCKWPLEVAMVGTYHFLM